jgi:uncharacterized integral membrane protein
MHDYPPVNQLTNIFYDKVFCFDQLKRNQTPFMDLAPLKTQALFPCLHIEKGINENHQNLL